MHDNGRGVARVFDKLLVLSWVLLVGGVVWHVHQWDPTTPFITEPLIDRVFLYSLILGMWGSFAAWWDITAEKNPWRLLSLRQVLEWLLVQTVYFAVSVGFHAGVLIGAVFAIDATIHRYTVVLVDKEAAILGPGAVAYAVTITFFLVAIASTFVVGRPFARRIITEVDDRWIRRGAD